MKNNKLFRFFVRPFALFLILFAFIFADATFVFAAAQPIPGIDISAKCNGPRPKCPKHGTVYRGKLEANGDFTFTNLIPNYNFSVYLGKTISSTAKPIFNFTSKSKIMKGRLLYELDEQIPDPEYITNPSTPSTTVPIITSPTTTTTTTTATTTNTNTSSANQKIFSNTEIEALADDKYASGSLPLGDSKYVLSSPKAGYIYLCRTMNGGGGAQAAGPWIHGNTWNFKEKINISGNVSWPNAVFSNITDGNTHTLSGNGLPINHNTGTFPVSSTDEAYKYDRNPNSIKTQNLSYALPANPVYSDTPSCMGGEVGITLSGVPMFNGFDAGMRDAAAHELQDSCGGHPQISGQYHYHNLSTCFKNVNVDTVLGYALDGFPITGGVVSANKYLTTEDLDMCHGITSEITKDGKKVTMYHYVMTPDFPYSVGCFRGKPATTTPSSAGEGMMPRPF